MVKETVSTTGLPVFLINVSGLKAVKVDAWESEEIKEIIQRLIVNRLVFIIFLPIPVHISINSETALYILHN